MSIFELQNFRESAEIFMCANTPSYLYAHLKESQEIENLASKLTAEELYGFCKKFLEIAEKGIEIELSFYICLVALSFKQYPELYSYLKLLKTNKYKWANSIISLIIDKYKVITGYQCEINLDKEKPEIIPPEKVDMACRTSVHKINLIHDGDKRND